MFVGQLLGTIAKSKFAKYRSFCRILHLKHWLEFFDSIVCAKAKEKRGSPAGTDDEQNCEELEKAESSIFCQHEFVPISCER